MRADRSRMRGGRWIFTRCGKRSWRGIHSEGGKKERREKQKATGRCSLGSLSETGATPAGGEKEIAAAERKKAGGAKETFNNRLG